MVRAAPALLPALLAAAATVGTAQSPAFHAATSVVALNVTVQDGHAHYVAGLGSSDFAVYENGVRQDVRFFYNSALPLDVILLLDTSSSMHDKIDQVQSAARGLLATLGPDDRAAVLGFADRVTVVQPLTGDRAALAAAALRAGANGYTALHNALYTALQLYGGRHDGPLRRQAIVVVTDGVDTSSVVAFADVLTLARQSGVHVYTVRLRSSVDLRWMGAGLLTPVSDDYDMKALADETGALAFAPMARELPRVYASIMAELAGQYAIGYEPTDAARDGRFRRVSVEVVGRPELHARTRSGYSARRE